MKVNSLFMPIVILLKPGSIHKDEYGRIQDARSSVTLIESGSKKIVVDTGTESEGELILNALSRIGLNPDKIDIVINTHSHPDHCGNNHLFTKAVILAPEEGKIIAPGVQFMKTPGHSFDSVSIIIRSSRVIIAAGDALPTLGNFIKNVPPALHVDRNLAISSMERITNIADLVIPGHDLPFFVKERKYVDLQPIGVQHIR